MISDSAHASDMQVFHQLFEHRTEIIRQISGGGQRVSRERYVGDDEEPSGSAALNTHDWEYMYAGTSTSISRQGGRSNRWRFRLTAERLTMLRSASPAGDSTARVIDGRQKRCSSAPWPTASS